MVIKSRFSNIFRIILMIFVVSVSIPGQEASAFNVSGGNYSFGIVSTVGLAVAVPAIIYGFYGINKLSKKFCPDEQEIKVRRARMLGIDLNKIDNSKNDLNSNQYLGNIVPESSENTVEPKGEPGVLHFDCEKVQTFSQLVDKFRKLPKFSEANKNKYKDAGITKDEFLNAIAGALDAIGKSSLANKDNWPANKLNKLFTEKDFLIKNYDKYLYLEMLENKFFAQKLNLTKNAKFHIHADIHGDIHSPVEYLSDLYAKGIFDDNFKIKDKDSFIVFLGDYVDRGVYGAEVLYLIAAFKIANPENVLWLRGNHENAKDYRADIYKELAAKFDINEFYIEYLLTKLYNSMPAAVFAGCLSEKLCSLENNSQVSYVLFCHAGLEHRFDADLLLSAEGSCSYASICKSNLSDKSLSKELKGKITKSVHFRDRDIRVNSDLSEIKGKLSTLDIGFLCSDFCHDCAKENGYNYGRGNVFSQEFTMKYLKERLYKKGVFKVECIIRGHQHAEDMFKSMVEYNGIYNVWADKDKQWSGKSGGTVKFDNNFPVWVLNVSPDNVQDQEGFENCDYDAYATLKLSGNSEDWSLEPHKVKVFNY